MYNVPPQYPIVAKSLFMFVFRHTHIGYQYLASKVKIVVDKERNEIPL